MEGDQCGTTQFVTLQKFAPTVSGILQQKRYELNHQNSLAIFLFDYSNQLKVPISYRRSDFTRLSNFRFRQKRYGFICVSFSIVFFQSSTIHSLSISGYLNKKELESALTGSGEPFSTDEMEEMWTAIKALRFPESDRALPSDAFDYTLYAKYMMK